MRINSTPVRANDRVWSEIFGDGTVMTTYPHGCSVRFDSARNANPIPYQDGGMRNGNRELYWATPIVIEIGKHDRPEVVAQAAAMFRQTLGIARGK